MGNGLKKLRLRKGWTHDQAGEAMNVSRGQFIKLERGERRLTKEYIESAMRAFDATEREVLGAAGQLVPVVGMVRAGSDAITYGDGDGGLGDVDAPEGTGPRTVAVEVRGDSLGAFFDGALLFYDEVRTPPDESLIGRICVCGLEDRRVVVKTLRHGQLPGCWTLFANVGPPMYDVRIEWAARVRYIRPK
jgi:transcriptional regulator with XRE-family HTH domain